MKNIALNKSLQTVLWTTLLAAAVGISACSNEPQETEADVVTEEQSSAAEPADMNSPETEEVIVEETTPMTTSETDTGMDAGTTTGTSTDAGTTAGMSTEADMEESMSTDTDAGTNTDTNTN